MRSRCLCQICTCGRHHCPHETTRIHEDSGVYCPTTEYLEKYPAYGDVLPAPSLKPKQAFQACGGQMEGMTTSKSDYRPYEVVRPPRHAPEEYQPKQGQMDLDTTYTRDFTSYRAQPVATVRPSERPRVEEGKVDTVPTYKDDYRAWDVQRSGLSKPEQTYSPPTVRFGNPTTFQDDYVPREMQPRQTLKPPSVLKPPAAPFQGDTSHRLHYRPHQLESKAARPKAAYRPPDQPFEDLTTHRHAFQGLLGESAKLCRPAPATVTQNAPFEGSTEFRESFQPWQIPPPEAVKQAPRCVPPPGAMQPHSSSWLAHGPHRASLRRNTDCPFQGQSTTREDFPAWGRCRRGLIKRQQQLPHPSGKFHGVTTYSTEYAPKTREVCPASYPSPPGHVYERTDSRGHRFFCRVVPTVKAF